MCFWVASGFLAQLTRTVRASGLSFGGIVVKDFGERVCLASCVESRWPVLFFFSLHQVVSGEIFRVGFTSIPSNPLPLVNRGGWGQSRPVPH